MKVTPILALCLTLIALSLPACNMNKEGEETQQEQQKIVATAPKAMDVTITQPYVCQIRSQNHIEVKILQEGYLEVIPVKEGQTVKRGEVLFKIKPIVYQTRLDAERAKAKLMQIKFDNAMILFEKTPPVISAADVALAQAELDEANAKVKTAEAELDFTTIKAPFDGIIDRQEHQQGSLVKKEEVLTTLSDNSVMRAYFNVPEVRYLGDMAGPGLDSRQIELVLADGSKFPQRCQSVIKEAKFNNETGNIAYRADFPNLDGPLRHGQTGTVLVHRTLKNALVIPQRATFEILDKRYVYVFDKEGMIHQREIVVEHEMDDIFVIKKGLDVNERIVLEGVRQVHDGEKVEYEFRKPEETLPHQKYHAE